MNRGAIIAHLITAGEPSNLSLSDYGSGTALIKHALYLWWDVSSGPRAAGYAKQLAFELIRGLLKLGRSDVLPALCGRVGRRLRDHNENYPLAPA
ncbi:unnamed protein product, partial [Iphiclides podalirius]